jgi:uncharacterized protein (DUF58 family)
MLVTSLTYALNLGFALCFLLTGLFASTLLATYLNLLGLRVETLHVAPSFVGSKQLYKITFSSPNQSLHTSIKINTQKNITDIIHVEPGKTALAELELPCTNRGWQALGRITISSDYPLGLWYGWSYFQITCNGLVYAKPEMNPPEFNAQHFGKNNGNVQNNAEEEYSSLKKYQEGEPSSRVAWKAVARGQGWYSKEFTSATAKETHHFSFADVADLELLEEKISRLTAWLIKSKKQGCSYSLSLPGYSSSEGNDDKHLHTLLKKLALYKHTEEVNENAY